MTGIKRLFLAVRIKTDIVCDELLPKLQHAFLGEKIHWANPNQLHLTLKFFGDTPVSHIPNIELAIKNAIRHHPPFTVQLKNIGIFGSRYKPQVIWLGMEDSNELKDLYKSICQHLEMQDFLCDRQNFVPHLTLARIKSLNDLQLFQTIISDVKTFEAETISIDNLVLFESQLMPKGALHVPLATFTLGKIE